MDTAQELEDGLEEQVTVIKKRARGVKERGRIPDHLSDVLAKRLTPSVRTAIVEGLIEMATELPAGPVKLKAVQEIFDRIEGRAKQTNINISDREDPLVALLKELIGKDQLIDSELTPMLEAAFLEIDEE